MTDFRVSRRAFLAGASLSSAAAAGETTKPKSPDLIEQAQALPFRKQTLERILAGHEAFLQEVKPSPAQLRDGLELHYDSFVGEVQGAIQVANTASLGPARWKCCRRTSRQPNRSSRLTKNKSRVS